MPEYGLALPEHDLTPQEFKDLARRLGRAAFVPLFLKFYERIVTSEATIEEQRKALVDISRWTGVEEEKKTDPNANLPVFNFVFGVGGRVEASLVTPTDTLEAADDALVTLSPEDVQALETVIRHKEHPDGQGLSLPDPATAADEPVVGLAGPPPRPGLSLRPRDRADAARAEPVPLRAAPAAGASPIQDGVPVIERTPAKEIDTLTSALASLDAALDGL